MEITQTNNNIEVVSTELSGYVYLHVYQKITTTVESIIQETYTDSSSSISLTTDGYYIISELKLRSTETPGEYYVLGEDIYTPEGELILLEDLMLIEDLEIRTDANVLSYYYIEKYYIDLVKSKFLKGMCSCACINDLDKITIDTLTMGIEVLDILIKYSQFYEAERMVEQLSVCTGIVNTNCSCNA